MFMATHSETPSDSVVVWRGLCQCFVCFEIPSSTGPEPHHATSLLGTSEEPNDAPATGSAPKDGQGLAAQLLQAHSRTAELELQVRALCCELLRAHDASGAAHTVCFIREHNSTSLAHHIPVALPLQIKFTVRARLPHAEQTRA